MLKKYIVSYNYIFIFTHLINIKFINNSYNNIKFIINLCMPTQVYY